MRTKNACAIGALLLTLAWAISAPPVAAQTQHSAADLAKQSQNPVGSLASLPFQFNFNTGGFLQDRTLLALDIQPVIPFSLNDNLNLLIRPIIPYVNVPLLLGQSKGGFADVQAEIFIATKGDFVWGFGPSFSFPTATNGFVSTGAWAVGANGVLCLTTGKWVLGILARELWTFSDDGNLIDEVDFLDIDAFHHRDHDREVNQTLIEPFINWNFGVGWALSADPVITANWDEEECCRWNVPLGGGITRTTRLGTHPINLSAKYYHNVERPKFGPNNQVQLQITFLFPEEHKKKKKR